MKPIYIYPNTSNAMSVSSIKRLFISGMSGFSVHHTLKDGFPQWYWFSIWDKEQGFVSVDIRKCKGFSNIEKGEKWIKLSDQQRLETICNLLSKTPKHDVIQLMKRAEKCNQ